jgi:uncharacterized protein YbjT (DUF2867 family)
VILVTGATGNIGSEIVKQLTAQNVLIRAMNRDRTMHLEESLPTR